MYLQIFKKAARHISQNSGCYVQYSNFALPIYKPESLSLGSTCKTPAIKHSMEWFLISPLVNFETHGTAMFFVKVFLVFQFIVTCLNLKIMNPNRKKARILHIIKWRDFADKFEDLFVGIKFSFYFRSVLTFVRKYSACEIRKQLVKRQMYSRKPTCGVFMLCIMSGFLQGYFSLPQGYPYQFGGYVYYPAPYIPPQPPMYLYPESCCCFGYEIETVFSEIPNQEFRGDGNTMSEMVTQMTSTADHPTTTTELSTQAIAETSTEPIIESSKITPEGTESTTESAKLITETTAESIIMTEYTQGSTTESTTNEYVSSTESTQHLSEATDVSTTKLSESTARSTDESTNEATESTTQTTVDFKTETPTVTIVSTTDSTPKEDNQYNVEEGITTSTIRTTEGNIITNTVT